MALETSIDENKWVLIRRGQDSETIVTASFVEIITAVWATTSLEYKYYGLTIATANSYVTAHPELNLELELIPNMPTACNLVKRSETRSLASVTQGATPTL